MNGGLSDEAADVLANIFEFDYMGSTEFEWGAVPAALSFIWEQASEGNIVVGTYREVFYLCPKEYEEGVKSVLDTLLKDEKVLRLKERCGLKDSMSSESKGHRKDLVGWLELNNGFMFFIDPNMFGNVKKLFRIPQ